MCHHFEFNMHRITKGVLSGHILSAEYEESMPVCVLSFESYYLKMKAVTLCHVVNLKSTTIDETK